MRGWTDCGSPLNAMNVKENIPLAPFTTFGLGGPARYFAEVETTEELKEAVFFARKKSVQFFVLGGGSNVLVSDTGFPGLVVKISLRGITHKDVGDKIIVIAAAGEPWDDFVSYAVSRGWYGVEDLSGVPGSVGAAPVQNIGCYGSEVKDVIDSVAVFDSENGQIKNFSAEECQFSYRGSLFKKPEGKKYSVLSATFRLSRTPQRKNPGIYVDNRFDIGELLKKYGDFPTPGNIRKVILDVRQEKGMVIIPGRESYNSAGSFFKAPILSRGIFEQVIETARRIDEEKEQRLHPWFWETGDGRIKIAPAFLFEFTGFNKGYSRGVVGISPKHSLAIINRGGAKAREIYGLARDMQSAVKKIFDIDLVPEVEYIGEF